MSPPLPDNDDQPVGHVLSRREVLALLGAAGAAWLAACAPAATVAPTTRAAPTSAPAVNTPSVASTAPLATANTSILPPACIARPAMTEGPYFVDEKLNRSDIRSDPSDNSVREGAEFNLTFHVSQVSGAGCVTLANAIVDIWHCDADGVYSDVRDGSFDTRGKQFLRGYQVTDANGLAKFTTIYPGWYPGRTVHIHFKIRATTNLGTSYEFTSQLFFDDTFTDQVYTQAPYTNKGNRGTRNENDGIFREGGNELTLAVAQSGAGYTADFEIGLQI